MLVHPSAAKVLQSSDGTSIYAEATGFPQNPHVVLLAGLSLSICIFDDMCAEQRLLDTLYIVCYYLRGHGRSGKPTTSEAYESKLFSDNFKRCLVFSDCCNRHLCHLPLSEVVYLSGMPATGELALAMVAPGLLDVLPGLLTKDDVAGEVFTDRLFARLKYMYLGHGLSTTVMGLCLSRTMDVEKLWLAAKEGLPLLIVQGTVDGHRMGGTKSVEDIMRPYFRNYEAVWLEGRGRALRYEYPNEITQLLINSANHCVPTLPRLSLSVGT
ncbi:alpha/beta-hydrolase [Mycena leptocephala]|nr:alpha/beta-hydrolase [Mycena leptocephala]